MVAFLKLQLKDVILALHKSAVCHLLLCIRVGHRNLVQKTVQLMVFLHFPH